MQNSHAVTLIQGTLMNTQTKPSLCFNLNYGTIIMLQQQLNIALIWLYQQCLVLFMLGGVCGLVLELMSVGVINFISSGISAVQKQVMSMKQVRNKERTSSFVGKRDSNVRNSSQKFGYSPEKSGSKIDRTDVYGVRFRRKDLREFEPGLYVTGSLSYQDVIDLKDVFDSYDSTGMGVLLPNDLKLLLTQNGFQPNRKTTYEIVAEFDAEETGGISFIEFMKAMDTKPYRNESKREIAAIFKKYDRDNKNYLTSDDFKEINNHVKENLDEETILLMIEKADSNKDGKITFDDFYAVMVKDIY